MVNMNLSALITALDATCRDALEDAAALCVSRGGHEIGLEDYLEKLLDTREMRDLAAQFDLSLERLRSLFGGRRSPEKPHGRSAPVFAPLLIEFIQEAYLIASLELGREQIDVFTLVLALLVNPARYGMLPCFRELGNIPADALKRLMAGLGEASSGRPAGTSAPRGESFLQKYATDFTEEARRRHIDPVFARGPQIRQMVDILTRRRKNNPILVGDPGVGKTAVVEGLALKIVQGDVPDVLAGTRLVGLDMGRLQAGASVKGEFEKRLKGVIDEIRSSETPTILFIDEAHTLVGSGNAAGSADGANLLKPALARGEMRTIAATTWSEYKKYFEKDAALARRFQLVRLDQPTQEETLAILRGLVPHYEQAHHVYIRDDAVRSIAELSTRYISGRQQPDKAVDLLDTACARVKVSLGAKPALLSALEEELAVIQRELQALERDQSQGVIPGDTEESAARHARLRGQAARLTERIESLSSRWKREKELVTAILARRKAMFEAAETAETAEPDRPKEQAGETPAAPTESASLETLAARLRDEQGESPLVFYEVTPQLVAEIVAEWTGIPLGKLTEDAACRLSHLKEHLLRRIRGQDHTLEMLEKAVLAARTGLNNPHAPTAIFLLVGPSGVGKTETALAIADELYGGEDMLISINMSEFQEKHTISRLIGSPPGYVGYGEGGRLTEAVRRQPYSVVLFDEVEKAHPDVLNLFYQMFDKGVLVDGEGRETDFRNTMIFLTSNLGSDIVAALCEDETPPDPATLVEALRPALTQFFRPALLGRMTIVPYMSLRPDIMRELVDMKISRIAARLFAQHRLPLVWSDEVAASIAASCTVTDAGARNIDHIINASLLPRIASALLAGRGHGGRARICVELDQERGSFVCSMTEDGGRG